MALSPEAQLEKFMARYTPEIVSLAQALLDKMRARYPGAVQMVYDNFYALVVGFGPNERASEAVFSIAMYPKWVNLFFLWGARLPDPYGVLRGSGKQVRFIRPESADELDDPRICELMDEAVRQAEVAMDNPANARMVIKLDSKRKASRVPKAQPAKGRTAKAK
jgi:hypothetical protein